MLPDYSRYYGCVLNYLVDRSVGLLRVRKLNLGVQGFYLLDERIPVYIKFSRSRKGPWSFTFRHEHQLRYGELVKLHGNCITALVCGKDGVAALNHSQLREVLDDQFDLQESISVRRKLKKMYSVNGTNGKLSQKIGRNSLLDLAAEMLGDAVVNRTTMDEAEDEGEESPDGAREP